MTSNRVLDPVERTLEVLFGLIMALVYTSSIDAGESDTATVHSALVGTAGCNFAWGTVDAVMYLAATFADRARGLVMLTAIRGSRETDTADRLIVDALPPGLAGMLGTFEIEMLRRRLTTISDPPTADLRLTDYIAAMAVFLLVFLSTFPVIVPFLLMREPSRALRASRGVAVAMLFVAGWSLGVHAGRPGWRTGMVTVLVGAVLSALTFALGG